MARGFGGVGPVNRRQRTNIVVIVGVVFAVICVIAAFTIIANRPGTAATQTIVVEREASVKMVDVLVPVADVAMGTALEPGMFRKESRPAVAVDPRSVKDTEEIKGYFSRSLVVAGQPLHKDMITQVRPANSLTVNIPDGYRAVTIRVDQRTSVEGFTQPGARVDVHWIYADKGQQAVTLIVQNAKVLSAERKTDQSGQASGQAVPSTVTLLVTDRDAAKISLASSNGTLTLTLRGDIDSGKSAATEKVTLSDLRNGSEEGQEERTEGTVMIGGKKFKVLPGGKMVPE